MTGIKDSMQDFGVLAQDHQTYTWEMLSQLTQQLHGYGTLGSD